MPPSVLIVDDDPLVCSFYRALLTYLTYQVNTLSYPPANLADIQRYQPDLIVVEGWSRDRADGVFLVHRLRQHSQTTTLPILLCTARWDRVAQYAQELRSLRVTVLFKPFDIAQFSTALDHLVGDTAPPDDGCAPSTQHRPDHLSVPDRSVGVNVQRL